MREIVWVKQAREEFEAFPPGTRDILLSALVVAAEGGKADIAKPMKGLGSGVMEIALAWRSDAYRVVYAVQIDDAVWVVHAFQKKSNKGIATPAKEIDLVKARLKRIREISS
jgi:phage-related protein